MSIDTTVTPLATGTQPHPETIRWEGKGVKTTDVANRLLDLRQSAADEEGYPLARASVMNLLVYASEKNPLELAVDTVDQLALRHPSRAIVIAAGAGKDFSLDAEVAIHRYPLASHGLIYERVVLHPRGADPEGFDTLVIPLLIPHLQSFLWWLGDPNLANPTLRSLTSICDRLVIDSSLGPADRLSEVALELGPGSALGDRGEGPTFGHLVIGDMAWSRLDGFRQALAGIFDERSRAEFLKGLTRFEVIGRRGARQPVTSAEILMAGWVASLLGCSAPAWATNGVSMRQEGAEKRALFTFSGAKASARSGWAPSLHGIRISAERGRRSLELELLAMRGEGQLTLDESSSSITRRTVHLPHPDEAEVLSRQLSRIGRDPVYENAMVAAARIQAALTS